MRSWYKKNSVNRLLLHKFEYKKLILKSLLKDTRFELMQKFYFQFFFNKFGNKGSISNCRRFCVISGQGKSIFMNFKMVRHQCKFYAAKGYLVGIRKASF
jgi:ribosomal protein S14